MKNRLFFFIVLITTFSACKEQPTQANDSANKETITTQKDQEITQVDIPGYKFQFILPQTLKQQGINSSIEMNDISGSLEIKAGPSIQIEISDQGMKLEEIKAELNDQQMFSYKFIDETREGFIFQAILPDGTAHYYNFITQKTINGKPYFIKNKDGVDFTLKTIKEMKKIAESIN